MAGLNETPKGNRIHIAFFGLRNAGKSTLVNEFTGQQIAIVNERAGTTTDPVSKAMEILPLGPCLVTDTAGLDDEDGELGAQRVSRSLDVLSTTDIAVWVSSSDGDCFSAARKKFEAVCKKCNVKIFEYRRGDSVSELKSVLSQAKMNDENHPLVSDLLSAGDCVVCVCPIDASAPKARLILPQQQIIREILDSGAIACVCKETEVSMILGRLRNPPKMVITDSQAFAVVSKCVPPEIPLTSFSILFARAKGDLRTFLEGAKVLDCLKDGDRILISEACTHHRQCEDIGTVKLPKMITAYSKVKPVFEFAAGNDFPDDLSNYALVVHCGGCMLTRRIMLSRIAHCKSAGVPIVNYGIAIAKCTGTILHTSVLNLI